MLPVQILRLTCSIDSGAKHSSEDVCWICLICFHVKGLLHQLQDYVIAKDLLFYYSGWFQEFKGCRKLTGLEMRFCPLEVRKESAWHIQKAAFSRDKVSSAAARRSSLLAMCYSCCLFRRIPNVRLSCSKIWDSKTSHQLQVSVSDVVPGHQL